jgi:hypothetical protein
LGHALSTSNTANVRAERFKQGQLFFAHCPLG